MARKQKRGEAGRRRESSRSLSRVQVRSSSSSKKRDLDIDLLFSFLNVSGPSGNEKPTRDLIIKHIKPYVDELRIDKFGNLICRKKGNGPKVMLAAHMDEIGLMIQQIRDTGDIVPTPIGGLEPMTILGEVVALRTKKEVLTGVVTTKEINDGDEIKRLPDIADLIVDLGMTKKELLQKGVSIGDYFEFLRSATRLGNPSTITGKALDDRIGCFILVTLAQAFHRVKIPADLYIVFTVQEEVGLYGARTSLYTIEPDVALVVETTNANDSDVSRCTKRIGNGPCITVKDADMIGNRKINDFLKEIAKKIDVPLQMEVSDFGTTDALSISVSKGGIPTGVISVPLRNIHTSTSVAHLDDIRGVVKVVGYFLKHPPNVCETHERGGETCV